MNKSVGKSFILGGTHCSVGEEVVVEKSIVVLVIWGGAVDVTSEASNFKSSFFLFSSDWLLSFLLSSLSSLSFSSSPVSAVVVDGVLEVDFVLTLAAKFKNKL